jgi:hypothetical protein
VLRDAECFHGRFEHGVNCLKAETAEEFAGIITLVAGDPSLAARLSAGALAYAHTHSLELVGQRLKQVYGQLM